MINLAEFETLAHTRQAIRHFRPDEIPAELLMKLLGIAQLAPSGYNLQPTHLVLVTDASLKERLYKACMKQSQILEAPAVVVFTGDRRVVEHNRDKILAQDRQAGAINAEYEKQLRTFINLGFQQGPLGIQWLGKALFVPLARIFAPIPEIPAVYKRYWLAKQAMLVAMNFMLAATAAGLATVPMEGFDEGRVKKVLGIPAHHIVALVVPVGYAASVVPHKTRLPLDQIVHKNGW